MYNNNICAIHNLWGRALRPRAAQVTESARSAIEVGWNWRQPLKGGAGGVANAGSDDGERVACGAFRCDHGDSPLRGVQGGWQAQTRI